MPPFLLSREMTLRALPNGERSRLPQDSAGPPALLGANRRLLCDRCSSFPEGQDQRGPMMPDVVVQNRGFLARLTSSLVGVILGPILIVAAIGLLWWNEGRAVQATTGLNDAAGQVVEAQASGPSPDGEGKLVHVVGTATASDTIEDPAVGAKFAGQVVIARNAEMYQWQEDSHDNNNSSTTYIYTRTWSDHPIDSSLFYSSRGHQNPPMPFSSTRSAAPDARLGGWLLDTATLNRIDLRQSLTPAAPPGWAPGGGYLYRGNPGSPKIGDMRVRYLGLPTGTTISVLAQQSGKGFSGFTTSNGYTVRLAGIGNLAAAELIARQRSAESITTWILRGVGWMLTFIGFATLLSPLSTLASLVPILGGLMRGAVGGIAFVISVPLTLIVIAFAWLYYRPLLCGGLLVLAAALTYGLWRWHHRHTAGRVATTVAETAAT
jgi:Transmembrane protein 43